jgi:hypothetical protein
MLKKIIITSGLLAACTFMSAHAAAQSYFGGSVGRAKWDLDCTKTVTCQTAAASAKLFGGYDINTHFAVEGSYIYLNKVTANRVTLVKEEYNGRGFDIAGVAKTSSYNNFVGFAKLGLAFMKGEVQVNTPYAYGSANNYSSQPLAGAGVTYNIDKKVKVRAEIDYRKVKVTGYVDTTYGVTNFSVGIQSEF